METGLPRPKCVEILFIGLLFIGFLATLSLRAVNAQERTEPDSYEFKVLLSNEEFQDRDNAIDEFLGRLKTSAKNHSAETDWKNNDKRRWKQRKVLFFDTKGGHLKDVDLIFRARVEMTRNCVPQELAKCDPAEAKVTLKRRSADGAAGPPGNTEPNLKEAIAFKGQLFESDSKIEADHGWELGPSCTKKVDMKLSHSSTVKTKDFSQKKEIRTFSSLGDVIALYPKIDWGTLGADATLPLISNCPIASSVVKVGKLKFNNAMECDASFSFWNRKSDQKPLATEFSFVCKEEERGRFAQIKDKAVAVFNDIIKDKFVHPVPDTKTAIARRCSADDPASFEAAAARARECERTN